VELRHLTYFLAVAETRNFTRAAENCFVAQSALSQQVARLETELGSPLFVRTSRSVRLTAAGELLLPLARQVLDAADHARAELDAFTGLRRGSLRIGFIQAQSTPVDMVGVLDAFHRRHPAIGLRVRNSGSAEMAAQVAAGSLDLAVVGLHPAQLPVGLAHELLAEDPLVAVVSPGHPLAGRETVDLGELVATGQFIQLRSGTGMRRHVEAAFTRAGLTAPQSFEVAQVQDMIRLAARDVGVTVVPRSAVHGPAAAGPGEPLRVLRLADAAAVHPTSVVYEARSLAPAAAAFLAALRTGVPAAGGGSIGPSDR
jgi:DNA-binding transcriptional LysR family regulator